MKLNPDPDFVENGLSRMAQPLLVVLLFLFLYNIHFSFFPIITSRIVLLGGVLYLALKALKGTRCSINSDMASVFVLGAASFLYATVNFAFHGFSDASLAKGTALIFLHSALGGFLFAVLFFRAKLDFRGMIKMLFAAISLQAVFIVLYFVSTEFRDFNLSVIVTNSNIDPLLFLHRARGIAGSYGASLGLVQSFGLLFGAYLMSSGRVHSAERALLVAGFLLITASVVVTGRTGLLMLPVVALYFFLLAFRDRHGVKSLLIMLALIPFSLAVSFLGLKYGAAYFPGNEQIGAIADRFQGLMAWIKMEVVVKDGRIYSHTLDVLLKQWFFPDGWSAILFGDPATWDLHRVHSDIGPVRLVFGGGLIGTGLLYATFIALFISSLKSVGGHSEKLFLLLLFAFLLVTEFKEPFLMKVNVNSYLFVIFFYLQLQKPDILTGLYGHHSHVRP